MMIRTYDADQLWFRVPKGTPNAEEVHKVPLPSVAVSAVRPHAAA